VSASTAEQTWKQFQFVLTVIQLCGWNIQMKKTSTEAVQKLAHLGFITDSVNLRYWLPVEKEDLVVSMLESVISTAMEGQQLSALELAKLLGRLNSMRRSHGTVLGVLTRTCQHLLGAAVNRYGWQCKLTLDFEAVRELQLLASKIRSLNGQHIFSCEARSKVVTLAETDRLTEQIRTTDKDLQNLYVSDASDSHVFIYKADGQFQYVREFELTAGERLASSGYRELLAVKKSLQEDPDQFRAHKGGTIFWQTDSKNCYGFLLRGSRQPDIQKVVMDIKCIERKLDVNIVPVWTPREHARIVTADLGSKLSSSTDEWCVDRDDLVKVFTKLNFEPEIDCMATRSNTLCEKFFSKIPQIGSLGVNFMSQELRPDTNYFCCPPVKMIGRVVCHILEKENIRCLLIVPVWPSSAFWPALSLSPWFQESIVKETRFQPKFFMSNSAPSLFSRCPKFEMVAFLMHT
jgi:hypothetical protein